MGAAQSGRGPQQRGCLSGLHTALGRPWTSAGGIAVMPELVVQAVPQLVVPEGLEATCAGPLSFQ